MSRVLVVTEAADQGRRLEQLVAAFFERCGYSVRTNEILEGRSGGRHEIDVMAEKSDALTTFRVGVECKAWQMPIQKDVVAKLNYVVNDLGLSKGIVVSLAGSRSGADQAAAELGIELWGPDHLRRQLGDHAVASLGVPAAATNASLAWGHPFGIEVGATERAIRSAGKGRFGLRSLETLSLLSALWLPAYCIRITCTLPERKRSKVVYRSTTIDSIYDALNGSYLGPVAQSWVQVQVEQRLTLTPECRDTKVHAAIRKAFASYDRVKSPSAVARHAASLDGLGIPTPCTSVSIDSTALVYLPFVVGVLDTQGRQRVVAVDGRTGFMAEAASRLLTANLPRIRERLAAYR
jgi:Restriction endonuclease